MSQTDHPPAKTLTIDQLGLTAAQEVVAADQGPNSMLYAWFQLFKTAQIHAIENQALHRPVQNFITVANRILSQEGKVSLQSKDRAIFINSQKLKLTSEEYELAYGVSEFFEERGMGGFTIDGSFDVAAVHRLLRIMVYDTTQPRKRERLQAALAAEQVPMRINKTLGIGARSKAEVVLERRGYTFLTYSKLVVLYRSLLAEEKLNSSRRRFLTKKIVRTIQSLVDICLEDDHTFLGVASVKAGDAYAPHHAANTAVLSIALGEKLGLSKVDLADLGLAAVFHDIGMKSVPAGVTDKWAALDASEQAMVEQHAMAGVEFLLEEKMLSRADLARIVVAFEHHRHVDGSGYPRTSRPPDLLSRIVAIASTYDALTTDRPWRKALLADEALGWMLTQSGKQFDATLLQVFVNTLGLYPVGTLARLSTGELAVVVYGGGEGERVSRPIVAVLDADGKPGRTVDLAEKGANGQYFRTIVRSEDPSKYGYQMSGMLAASPGISVSS